MTELIVVKVCMVRHPPLLRITTPFGCDASMRASKDLWPFSRFSTQLVAQTKTLTTIVLCNCTLISRPFHLIRRLPPREPLRCLCPPGTPIPTGRRFWRWLFGLKFVGLNLLCWSAIYRNNVSNEEIQSSIKYSTATNVGPFIFYPWYFGGVTKRLNCVGWCRAYSAWLCASQIRQET